MLLSILADLHLTDERNAPQYDALRFALDSIRKHRPDAVAVIGDMTADGSPEAAAYFLREIHGLAIPLIMIAGNSDLRRAGRSESFQMLCTDPVLSVGGYTIIGLDDAAGSPTSESLRRLEDYGGNCIVLKHHPNNSAAFNAWRSAHSDAYVIAGHMHCSLKEGRDIVVQALDPDKAIGEMPCITYLNFEGSEVSVRRDAFPCPIPADFKAYIGISCSRLPDDIAYAAAHGIQKIELHHISADRDTLKKAIADWRKKGGDYLSIHMPDCTYENSCVQNDTLWADFTAFAREVSADGLTIHVPKVPVREMTPDGEVWKALLDFIEKHTATLQPSCVIGIENMHMTAGEPKDENRRFGCLPEECIAWKNAVAQRLSGRCCGNLLDIGHARNNPPFSQHYQIGSWYALLGGQTVAYHIHQCKMNTQGVIDNHKAFEGLYGPLISLASFLYMWDKGTLNKKPIFLEMRHPEYIEPSLHALGFL